MSQRNETRLRASGLYELRRLGNILAQHKSIADFFI